MRRDRSRPDLDGAAQLDVDLVDHAGERCPQRCCAPGRPAPSRAASARKRARTSHCRAARQACCPRLGRAALRRLGLPPRAGTSNWRAVSTAASLPSACKLGDHVAASRHWRALADRQVFHHAGGARAEHGTLVRVRVVPDIRIARECSTTRRFEPPPQCAAAPALPGFRRGVRAQRPLRRRRCRPSENSPVMPPKRPLRSGRRPQRYLVEL
jgi:hypothetical protein